MTLQGPFYVGTGCMFRRFALYGFDPPQPDKFAEQTDSETEALKPSDFDLELQMNLLPKRFGNSAKLAESIPIAEYQGRPLQDNPSVKYGRPPGALRAPRDPLDAATVAEAVSVISCWYVMIYTYKFMYMIPQFSNYLSKWEENTSVMSDACMFHAQ